MPVLPEYMDRKCGVSGIIGFAGLDADAGRPVFHVGGLRENSVSDWKPVDCRVHGKEGTKLF